MYTMLEIYDAVSRFPALRDIRSQHVPQDAVLEMMTRKGTAQKTVETGFSPLSIMLFALMSRMSAWRRPRTLQARSAC